MKNKTIKLLSVMLLLGICLSTLHAQTRLYIRDKTGASTSFLLSEVRNITLPSGDLILTKTDGNTSTYALADLRYLSFIDYAPTDVKAVKSIQDCKINLYPNPVNDQLHITYESDKAENLRLQVFNIQGKVLYQEMINSQVGTNTEQFDVSQLQKGLYLLRLSGNKIFETIKFIKN